MATKKKLITRYIAFNRDIFDDPDDGAFVSEHLDNVKEYDFYIEVKGSTENCNKIKKVGTVMVK